MAYATLENLLGRAGRTRRAWDDESEPSLGDVEQFLEDVAGQIDATLAGRGLDLPVPAEADAALLPLNADAALLIALEATFTGSDTPDSVKALIEGVRKRVDKAWKALEDGSHAAVKIIEGSGDPATAGDFWTTEPGYGTWGARDVAEAYASPNLQPGARRNMGL